MILKTPLLKTKQNYAKKMLVNLKEIILSIQIH